MFVSPKKKKKLNILMKTQKSVNYKIIEDAKPLLSKTIQRTSL